MGDYAAKEMKLKRVATISEDFAFGHEQMAAFQRVFEDTGGKVVKKLWPPLVTPDYTPFIAQIGNVDGVFNGFAGSNPVKFMRAYADLGLKGKIPLLAGWTAHGRCAAQEPRRRGGRRDLGSLLLGRPRHPEQQALRGRDAEGLRRAARRLFGRHVRRRPVRRGRHRRSSAARPTTARRSAEALHRVSLDRHAARPVKFDQYGNVVGEVFIRRCERKDGQLVNTVIKTYPERQPVLDLPREGVPGEPGLHARLSAGQEPGELSCIGASWEATCVRCRWAALRRLLRRERRDRGEAT